MKRAELNYYSVITKVASGALLMFDAMKESMSGSDSKLIN